MVERAIFAFVSSFWLPEVDGRGSKTPQSPFTKPVFCADRPQPASHSRAFWGGGGANSFVGLHHSNTSRVAPIRPLPGLVLARHQCAHHGSVGKAPSLQSGHGHGMHTVARVCRIACMVLPTGYSKTIIAENPEKARKLEHTYSQALRQFKATTLYFVLPCIRQK